MNAQRKTAAKKSTSTTAAKKTTAAASSAAETVVNLNNKAMQDIQTSLNSEAQKAQEKMYEMGRESAEQFTKSADAAGQAANQAMAICRDNIEACVESGNIAASIAKEASEELVEYINHTASENAELGKEFLACRTLNDVVELQNKVMKNSVEGCFEQYSNLANAMFQACNEIAEPINQRIAEATDEISKLMSQK